MLFSKLVSAAVVSCLAAQSAALAYGGKPSQVIKPYKRAPLQEILIVEAYRLPVPSLWLDVFQKIKALGYDGVSFYTDWALLEGQPGNFTAEGVFALEPFFDAAKTAGIYLLARPGPYINAEVSGGGYPGWLQRIPGRLRTTDASYLNSTDNYVENIGRIIAKAQITNGGPVILFQPENEYSQAVTGINPFPDPTYFAYVEDQFRKAGIVVPYISNDARPQGFFAPPKPAAVDIYGHDGYPLGFDCANPYTWPDNGLPTNYRTLHLQQSPSTPYAIVEFQGGSFDPWGGLGFAQCGDLLNYEFERVFYKNDFSFGVTIFNIYMTYGGTNWGNLGHPGGYTSYDYGAAITEDRLVTREKYSEAKLEANFLQASPAYLTAVSQDNSHANGSYTDSSAIAVTALFGNVTRFFVARHAAYNSLASTNYKLTVPTSQGNITIPQLGGTLTLNGRDSKIHVTDYDLGGINLLYSSAEIFTWKRYASKTVLVVYGGPNERHELAVSDAGRADTVEGSGVTTSTKNGATILNWQTSPKRRVVQLHNNLYIYILGDLNATASIEVIGAPNSLSQMSFNGKSLKCNHGRWGSLSTSATYQAPKYSVPDLNTLKWKVIDSLPEVQSTYDDSAWTSASLTYSNNTARNLTTPTSLYASDYGYHTGNLLFRGHFTATGAESTLYLSTQGGSATGMSAWLNGVFMGSFPGYDAATNSNKTFTLPNVAAGTVYVVTVLIDNMGLDENFNVGGTTMKNPRGILDYSLAGRNKGDIKWKLTGNLGGENYRDRTRGPLNEGGLYAERQGYHLPGAPTSSWANSAGPTEGIKSAGVAFYATTFDLDMPAGYDIPLSFVFANSTTNSTTAADGKDYRVQLYVNGYQFGKYVHNIGPQDAFPVPEGIFNYHGSNYVAMSLWALDAGGAKVEGPGWSSSERKQDLASKILGKQESS
ncbi:hypothetical protein LTR60_000118, partial [Cryomyces antarcticus]